MPMPCKLLEIKNLKKDFNGIRALNDISLTVNAQSIHGLIGPNGAGKTTLFNMVSGVYPATSGQIEFDSKDITNTPSHLISGYGISRTFQNGLVVPTMTCLENVLLGCLTLSKRGFLKTLLPVPFTETAGNRPAMQTARRCLDQAGLAGFEHRWAGELVWVERQLLQFARALAAKPKLLLLDEPTAGMGYEEAGHVIRLVNEIRGMGITIILVSHDINFVLGLADRITVLNFGNVIFEGTPAQVRSDPLVCEAYLGTE